MPQVEEARKGAWSPLVAVACVAAVLLLPCGAARARTYYVAPAGDDNHTGTEAEPLGTIQRAADLARAGDTILLRGGVYPQRVVLRHSGEAGKPITLRNAPGEHPVIQPAEKGQRPPGQAVLLQAEAGYQHAIGWITVEGLEIRHGHDGVKIYNAHDVVIRGCRIHDNWNQGILGNGNRVLIDRNVIAANGTSPDYKPGLMHGIYATGTAFTITNNVIHSNSAYGIQVAAYDYKPQEMAGPEYAEAKDWLIANNTLALNKLSSGIVLWQDGVENCQVLNNIFYKNGGPNGIVFYTQRGRRHAVKHNLFFPPGENLASAEPDAYDAADNQQADPQFVDPAAFDFHLKPGSPAIDAGADLTERGVTGDVEGDPRPQGAAFDVGADEAPAAQGRAPAAAGPLRIHPDNPRYFTDGTKGPGGSPRAVYLTGSHHWNNLQDTRRAGKPVEPFDYDAYLRFMEAHGHNFMRMWAWEDGENDVRYEPVPFARTDAGKYDLTRFNEDYFRRLRERVGAARRRGIYVSVMLFQGWSIYGHGYGNPWPVHPFNRANNVNGIDGDPDHDGEGKEVHSLAVPAVTRLQEAYVRKVVDAVNDLDNVLYEVTNETAIFSKDWQYHVVNYLKEYEAAKPKQHPVGMTAFDSGRAGSMKALLDGPADWIAPQNDGTGGDYQNDPPASDGRKVILSDTDHLWGVGGGRDWVWRSFTRGLNPIYMDPLGKEAKYADREDEMEGARRAMGDTRRFADRTDLAAMKPAAELASTRYCLADPGREYLVYLPGEGAAAVDLSAAKGDLSAEWFDPVRRTTVKSADSVPGGARRELKAPFAGPAVLYLKAVAPR